MNTPGRKPAAFLDVEKSLTGHRWVERLDAPGRNIALAIAQATGLPDLVARVLAGRGVSTEEAETFLTPSIRDLMPDPSVMTQMDAAAARLADAVVARERVAIFGDYDVDGACASAMLGRFLAAHDIPFEIYIPDRIIEGYGPNSDAIRTLAENGAALLVTVDCGSTSHEALETARELALSVLVLDHHQVGSDLPPAHAVVNPNREDDLSGLGHLCAAGVVFMTLVAVQRELRARNRNPGPSMLDLLDLAALATVCDVVPLKGLNRAFVVRGLQLMRSGANEGIAALLRQSALSGPLAAWHLGFMLGPRINAGGRIGDAALGSRLLMTDDSSVAEDIAVELERLNRERQAAEAVMLEEAVAEAEAEIGSGDGPAVLVAARNTWHPGIVGLLASRLKDRFRRPAFAIAFNAAGKGSGSGRSVAGVDIGRAVRDAVEAGILEKGGGHAMAAGITVTQDRLGDLRAYFEDRLSQQVAASNEFHRLKIDGALTARGATLELIDRLEQAGPYGQGHSQPVFAFPGHSLKYAKQVGRDHVSVTLAASDGSTLRAIAFRIADEPLGRALLQGQGKRFHFAGTLSADHWQGTRRVQLRLQDAAEAD